MWKHRSHPTTTTITTKHAKEALEIVYSRSENEMKRTLDLLQPKGTSAWLTCLPPREQNFYMNSDEFRDALCLRYGWHLKGMAQTCECGAANNIDHALIYKLGGFVIMRHNAVRNLEDNARLDISCQGFWAPLQKMFPDVRYTHSNAPSNRNRKLKPLLETHENRKKVKYNDRYLQVEHASFTPLIFATNGAMGEEAEPYHALLAEKLSEKLNCAYADTKNYIRKKLSFTILKTALIALRGHRKKQQYTSCSTRDTDINILCHNQ